MKFSKADSITGQNGHLPRGVRVWSVTGAREDWSQAKLFCSLPDDNSKFKSRVEKMYTQTQSEVKHSKSTK